MKQAALKSSRMTYIVIAMVLAITMADYISYDSMICLRAIEMIIVPLGVSTVAGTGHLVAAQLVNRVWAWRCHSSCAPRTYRLTLALILVKLRLYPQAVTDITSSGNPLLTLNC